MINKAVDSIGDAHSALSLIFRRFASVFSTTLIITITAVLIVSCGGGSDGGKSGGGDATNNTDNNGNGNGNGGNGNGGEPEIINTITGIMVNGKAVEVAERSGYTPSTETAVDVKVEFGLPRPEDATAGEGDWSPTDAKVKVGLKDEAKADLTGCKSGLKSGVTISDTTTADTTFDYNFAHDCVVVYIDGDSNKWSYKLSKNPPNWIYNQNNDWNYLIDKKLTAEGELSGSYKLLTNISYAYAKSDDAIIKKYNDGTFDGGGHIIIIEIDATADRSHLGLFGIVGDTSVTTIRNIIVDGQISTNGSDIFGSRDDCSWPRSCVGGLVGLLEENGKIINATSTLYSKGAYHVGGLVGYSAGTIIGSTASRGAEGEGGVGGLVGSTRGISEIKASTVSGRSITGTKVNTGGLVGWAKGKITSSYASVGVAGDNNVGGLVGRAQGQITSSYASGAVTGTGDSVGGLVGLVKAAITSSYALGIVSGSNKGGFAGSIDSGGSIVNSRFKAQGTLDAVYRGSTDTNTTNVISFDLDGADNAKGFLISEQAPAWTAPWMDLNARKPSLPYLAAPADLPDAVKTKWVDDQKTSLQELLR